MGQKIAPSVRSRMEELAREDKHYREIANLTGVSVSSARICQRQIQGCFSTPQEYLDDWARQMGFEHYRAYSKEHKSLKKTKKLVVTESGKRVEKMKLAFGIFVTERLKELGKTRRGLSRELGISPELACKYSLGKYLPRDLGLQRRLFSALNASYICVDEFFEKEGSGMLEENL